MCPDVQPKSQVIQIVFFVFVFFDDVKDFLFLLTTTSNKTVTMLLQLREKPEDVLGSQSKEPKMTKPLCLILGKTLWKSFSGSPHHGSC